jgi:hypothetical protein
MPQLHKHFHVAIKVLNMKQYVTILTLLIGSYVSGQDTALFNRIDSIVAKVDLAASKSTFDTLKSSQQNSYPPGTTSDLFLLRQGRVVQKIYIIDKATNAREFVIFQSGEPVLREVQGPSSTRKYYFDGESSYLYFKEDNRLITDSSKFNYGQVERYLSLFKDQLNKDGN